MRIKALFFATYRDIAGSEEIQVEVPTGSSVADLVSALRARGERWLALPARPAVAVNLDYSPLATTLSDGDEVAFIPPVGGG